MASLFDLDRETYSNLVKAVVIELDKKTGEPRFPGGVTPVLFNPSEISKQKSNRYPDQTVQGRETPQNQFTGGDAGTISMELFFDTYEEKIPVSLFTERIEAIASIERESHEPPPCQFVWGAFMSFKAHLQSVNTRYTMFLPTGIPVRARMDVTFKEYDPSQEGNREAPLQSSDRTKVRTVTEGDTLWLIAAREYGDPGKWRPIAEANGIENPRALKPGSELVLPPLEP